MVILVDDFKRIVANNITTLRTLSGLTQAALGERLNYSDKSVSKWERGESLPDAYVLKNMADLFGVTVDYLLTEHDEDEPVPAPAKKVHRYSRRVISMVVMACIWTLALLIFIILWIAGTICWQIFVYTVPVSLITLLVLNSVWGIPRHNLYIISGIVWGIISSIYLTALEQNWWQLFLIGVPAQIIIVLSFAIKRRPKKQSDN